MANNLADVFPKVVANELKGRKDMIQAFINEAGKAMGSDKCNETDTSTWEDGMKTELEAIRGKCSPSAFEKEGVSDTFSKCRDSVMERQAKRPTVWPELDVCLRLRDAKQSPTTITGPSFQYQVAEKKLDESVQKKGFPFGVSIESREEIHSELEPDRDGLEELHHFEQHRRDRRVQGCTRQNDGCSLWHLAISTVFTENTILPRLIPPGELFFVTPI